MDQSGPVDQSGPEFEPSDPSQSQSGAESQSGAGSESQSGFGSAHDSESDGSAKTKPLWRNRDYVGWWLSSLISSLGSSMSQITYPLLMLYATGSVARAGVVGACLNLGGLATTLPGGVIADRFPRRPVIVGCYLGQAVGTGTVVYAVAHGDVNVLHIAAVALIQGMLNGISGASLAPVLRRLVRPEQFPAMSAARQGRDMGASLIGPPVGGALFSVARWLPFLGDAVSFAVAAVGVAAIRRPLGPDRPDRASRPGRPNRADHHHLDQTRALSPENEPPHPDGPSQPTQRDTADPAPESNRSTPTPPPGGIAAAVAEIRAGVGFIRGHPFLRFAVPWAALINALATGLVLLVIALLKQRGAGPSGIGAITSAAAVGGLLGAVSAPLLARRVSGRALVLSASWAVVGAAVAVALAPKPWQIGVIGAGLVFLIVPLTVVLETYELRVVPEELLGRVLSARQFAVSSLLWTATPVAGVLADAFGAESAVLVLAGCFAATALWTTASRAVRLVDQLPDPSTENPSEVPFPRAQGRDQARRRDNQATNNLDKELSFGTNSGPREGE